MPQALGASCDTYFYKLGYAFYAACRPGPPAAGVGEPIRVRRENRHRRRARTVGSAADARVAEGHLHEEDRPGLLGNRPALEAGRLDPARDRPEGHARHAAADDALLRDDRQRRQPRHAAHRRRDRGARQPATCAPASTPDRHSAVFQDSTRAGRGPGGLYRGDPRLLWDGDVGIRQLPGLDRRQDRDGREGRAAARVREAAPAGPVVVVRLRPADKPKPDSSSAS